METKTNNELIAEFLGAIKAYRPDEIVEYDLFSCPSLNHIFTDDDGDDPNSEHYYTPEEMRFDSSLDWLMPVVAMIESKSNEDSRVRNHFEKTSYIYFVGESIATSCDLDGVYNEIVKFIKWYSFEEAKRKGIIEVPIELDCE